MMLTPWYSSEEWEEVRDLVVERDRRAVDMMEVWRCRVVRLPAGVETSLALLSALSQTPHTPLSLGTAVNRFLNHVGHLGMNTWGLSKLHEAAEKLSVPEWLVQVRHETTHGNMPSLTILRAALEFGLSWLDVNYWNCSQHLQPAGPASPESECEASLESLLDLYLYLKLYQVWGTERMSELAAQPELWSHLSSQWTAVSSGRPADLASLTVRQAVGRVKTEVCSLLDRDSARLDLLADILVREDLLVPSSDFLDSLETEDSSEDTELPPQLVQIWSEFLNILAREGGLVGLVSRLLARAATGCHLSAGWVSLLGGAMLGSSSLHSTLSISAESVTEETLQTWLQSPGPLTAPLCPLLCQLAKLPRAKQQSVQALVNTMVGVRPGQAKSDLTVFSLSDLLTSPPSPHSPHSPHSPEGDCTSWTVLPQHSLDSQPLGSVLGGSAWDSLWVEGEWSRAGTDCEEETVPKFDISPIDWSCAPGVRTTTTSGKPAPHFYSNVPAQQARHQDQQDGFRRRKRLKKS